MALAAAHDDWPRPASGRTVILNVRLVSGNGGGIETDIIGSAPYFRTSNYWMAAAYMHRPGDRDFAALQRRAAAAQCELIAIPDHGPLDPRATRQLLALCRHLRVGIWHGHDYKANFIGLLLRRWHPMALLSTAHGWVTQTRRTPLYYAIDRWCLRRYDHVISVSPDLFATVEALGVPAARHTLSVNAVDEQRFRRRRSPQQAPLRARYGIAANRRLVGALGRLSEEKGFADLIRAVHTLRRDGYDLALWIAGEGPDRPALERLIDQLHLTEHVRLLGFVDDPVEVYEALDAFVLSSVREALPDVVLEAMAMRVPVIAAAVGGVPAAVRNAENGLLYPASDGRSLTAALRHVLDDAVLCERMTAAARRTVEERFTFAQRMASDMAVYDRLSAAAT